MSKINLIMKTGGIDKLDIDFLFAEGEFVLVASRWNSDIVDKLVEGAMKELSLQGIDQNKIRLIRVPGAFEIPLMCQEVINRGDVLAILALGVSIVISIISPTRTVFWFVIFGWSGIAATFCPVIILSIFWKGITEFILDKIIS